MKFNFFIVCLAIFCFNLFFLPSGEDKSDDFCHSKKEIVFSKKNSPFSGSNSSLELCDLSELDEDSQPESQGLFFSNFIHFQKRNDFEFSLVKGKGEFLLKIDNRQELPYYLLFENIRC